VSPERGWSRGGMMIEEAQRACMSPALCQLTFAHWVSCVEDLPLAYRLFVKDIMSSRRL
jgi:hypothetical protein